MAPAFGQASTENGSYQIAFGHRRLSIIDIGGGAQPMASDDGKIVLVFNGEIYNYVELRDELRGTGHVFRTASDTEVLIEAYRAWGLDALPRLRGMFAFALWDSRSQRLVLARDAFGKKPLFYSQHDGGIIFSSEIEPLIRFPKIDNSLEPGAIGHYLLNRFVPGPSTFFRGVKKLPGGCFAVWEGKAFQNRALFHSADCHHSSGRSRTWRTQSTCSRMSLTMRFGFECEAMPLSGHICREESIPRRLCRRWSNIAPRRSGRLP